MEEKNELKTGEVYLSGKINLGLLGTFDIALFKNVERTEENKQPHWKGKNILLWVNKKK